MSTPTTAISITPPIVLHTARLTMRTPQPADIGVLAEKLNHIEIARNLYSLPHPYTYADAAGFVERAMQRTAALEDFPFMLVLPATNEVIGGCGVHPNYEHRRAEIGYWIALDQWGHGYATEACVRGIAFAFETLLLHRVYASYYGHNPASRRVQEKAGMVYEGMQRGHILKWGERVDLGTCGLLRAEWEAQRAQAG